MNYRCRICYVGFSFVGERDAHFASHSRREVLSTLRDRLVCCLMGGLTHDDLSTVASALLILIDFLDKESEDEVATPEA